MCAGEGIESMSGNVLSGRYGLIGTDVILASLEGDLRRLRESFPPIL